MKVLVTGGAGFIGGHIVERVLLEGHQAAVVDDLSTGIRNNIPDEAIFFEVDIRNRSQLAAAFDSFRPDVVFHQAAQMSVSKSVREPAFDAEVNIVGFINVLEEVDRVGTKRVVFASSGGVLYGDVTVPVDENYPKNPQTPYGIAKWTGEKYLEFFCRERNLEGVALRYANVYGPRQNPLGEAGVAAIFSTKLLAREQATINGDGKYIRDYVYVADVVEANFRVMQTNLDENFVAFNVGTGIPTDVNQLEESIRKECQKVRRESDSNFICPPPTHGLARPGDLRSNLISAEKAKEKFGWVPHTVLSEGIADTVTWFAEDKNH